MELVLRKTDVGTYLALAVCEWPNGGKAIVMGLDEFEELVETARNVVDSWESGDLADAVNMLRICVTDSGWTGLPEDEEDE